MPDITSRLVIAGLAVLCVAGCGSAGRASTWSLAPVPPVPSGAVPASPGPDAPPLPSLPTPPSPAVGRPVETALRAIRDLPDRTVAVAGLRVALTGARSVALGPPGWAGALPVDDHTLALASTGTSSVEVRGWHLVGGSSTWLADLDEGVMRQVDPVSSVVDVDRRGQRLLLFELDRRAPVLHVTDRDRRRTASLRGTGLPHAAFLDDGTVAVTDGPRVAVWDPDTGSTTWSDLPQGLDDAFVAAVGDLVVLNGQDGSALVDPRTGRSIGESWRGSGPEAVAASPDGSRFAVGVTTPGEPRGRVELRDAGTGQVLAIHPGRLLSNVEAIAWPTDGVVIVMRASTGAEQTAVPEVHLAEDFAATPIVAEPFIDAPHALVARQDLVAAFGMDGPTVLLRVAESRP